MENGNVLFIDLETTGLNITTSRIVQIGLIWKDEAKTILINPEIPIPSEASRIHKIYDEDVKNAKTFKQIAPNLLKLINKCDAICGYNSKSYDIPILYIEFLRVGLEMPQKSNIDVYQIVNELFKSKKLKDIYLTLSGKKMENAHDAGQDIKYTKELLEIIQQKFLKEK